MTDARESSLRLAALLRSDQGAVADFLVALVEFHRERLWVQLGHASLFKFLHHELGLSNAAAYYRKVAAELALRFPEVVEPLRDGRLCITSVIELARVMTEKNRAEVLPRFFRVSKKEARAVAVEIRPMSVIPQREVRAPLGVAASFHPGETGMTHPEGGPLVGLGGAEVAPDAGSTPTGAMPTQPVARPPVAPAPKPRVAPAGPTSPGSSMEPLTAELCRLHLTVSKRFLAKLDGARAGESHVRRGASSSDVLELGLDLLLDRQARRRGETERPQVKPRPSSPDHLPAAVRRAVWARDGGQCQWPLSMGGVCGSTLRVQVDHVIPRARGGPSTVENCRLLCRVHNDLAARLVFGDDWMDAFTSCADG
ncbi:MAG: HNH endonuclease signature motif containing protein [Anaeromyxobacteraceae bacterium]